MSEFDLVQIRPLLAGDVNLLRGAVVGDTVRYIGGRVLRFNAVPYVGKIDLTHDRSTCGIDLENIGGLPLVGIDISVDVFELVEIVCEAAGFRYSLRTKQAKGGRVVIIQVAGAVADDQVLPISGDTPTFRPDRKLLNQFEIREGIYKHHILLPGELIDRVAQYGDALAEVFRIERQLLLDPACFQVGL